MIGNFLTGQTDPTRDFVHALIHNIHGLLVLLLEDGLCVFIQHLVFPVVLVQVEAVGVETIVTPQEVSAVLCGPE